MFTAQMWISTFCDRHVDSMMTTLVGDKFFIRIVCATARWEVPEADPAAQYLNVAVFCAVVHQAVMAYMQLRCSWLFW
jgi:hypothetical protein